MVRNILSHKKNNNNKKTRKCARTIFVNRSNEKCTMSAQFSFWASKKTTVWNKRKARTNALGHRKWFWHLQLLLFKSAQMHVQTIEQLTTIHDVNSDGMCVCGGRMNWPLIHALGCRPEIRWNKSKLKLMCANTFSSYTQTHWIWLKKAQQNLFFFFMCMNLPIAQFDKMQIFVVDFERFQRFQLTRLP